MRIIKGHTYEHRKGGLYVVIDDGLLESDGTEVVIYRAVSDQQVWVRPIVEFADGRFKEVTDDPWPRATLPDYDALNQRYVREDGAVTLSGRPPEKPDEPGAPAPIEPETGMHKDYWVLSKEELAKGFVRPVRTSYKHSGCGHITTMARTIAETYARNPKFYGMTFCVNCKEHLPVEEFYWTVDGKLVGS